MEKRGPEKDGLRDPLFTIFRGFWGSPGGGGKIFPGPAQFLFEASKFEPPTKRLGPEATGPDFGVPGLVLGARGAPGTRFSSMFDDF